MVLLQTPEKHHLFDTPDLAEAWHLLLYKRLVTHW